MIKEKRNKLQAVKPTKGINKKLKKVEKKIEDKIDKEVKEIKAVKKEIKRELALAKRVPDLKIGGTCHPMGTFKQCLMYPRTYLARTPRSTSKSVIVHYASNFNIVSNTSGNIGFVFLPFLINDTGSTSTGSSPFWYENASSFNGSAAEVTTGWTAALVNTPINQNSFTAARCISAYIEAVPNLSLTTSQGRGYIAMSSTKLPNSVLMNNGSISGSVLSQLQLLTNIQKQDYYAQCYVSKMQGLSGHWIPYEATDLLDYPPINFVNIGEMAARHPQENVIFGQFTGMPASTSVTFNLRFNVELIVDNQSQSNGLFPLLGDLSKENVDPIKILAEVYRETPNFVFCLDSSNNEV